MGANNLLLSYLSAVPAAQLGAPSYFFFPCDSTHAIVCLLVSHTEAESAWGNGWEPQVKLLVQLLLWGHQALPACCVGEVSIQSGVFFMILISLQGVVVVERVSALGMLGREGKKDVIDCSRLPLL